ncbi:MAG: anhydro-N-acetylmuramic acid kinase [Lentimicrobiaceae bacterium]|nr:anhydro-N-acetylmuramic acid kinase [Lentimicrobiaceae bacterium]
MQTHSQQFVPCTLMGLMSGTSLDGLDLALCDFWNNEQGFHYNILQTQTFQYPQELSLKLRQLFEGSALFLCEVEVEFSNFMAQCVNIFLENAEKKPYYLASHGHTVFHQPEHGLTKQIGSGAILAAKTGIPTICDFRTTDVAWGGQGAPLVPIGDALLFHQYAGCLNLGGISNISQHANGVSIAHDISLCNILLNFLAEQCGYSYDKEGMLAQKGAVHPALLEALNKPDYFLNNKAKSIGFELFSSYYRPLLNSFSISIEDKLRTVCEHIAMQVAQSLKGMPKVLVTGGGAKNSFLISLLKEKTETTIIIPENQLVDFKEALIFAFLGYLRIHETNNCLCSVTGASQNSCGGAIYMA